MMRILYGVQGTGNGHLTRARVMASALAKAGVQVDYLFSGRDRDAFFDMAPFGNFRCLKGLTFVTERGQIRVPATLRRNKLGRFFRDARQLDLSDYDLVLNDFEPVTAWAAKRQGKPCIGISHQNAFTHPVPITGMGWQNRLVMKYFAPTTLALGCHWHHFGCDLLPPFVEPMTHRATEKDKIVVYLPFEAPGDILALLTPFGSQRFRVYHGAQAPTGLPGHVQWCAFSRGGFQADLASCNGVIASAGFELVSEALVLGKKLLLKPLQGQFEQQSNALALELLGAAEIMPALSCAAVDRWLTSAGIEPISYPDMSEDLVTWLLAGRWDTVSELCRTAWARAELPEGWRHKWATAY